ncbi:MAG: S41 family peptidase, partial [Chloroflexi bacterium]|nr:S41 family peptidase [Chloroflexota bacterium]
MENKKILIMALVVGALTSLVAAYGAGYYNSYTGFNLNDTALSGVVGAWNLITEEYVEPEKIDTELLAGAAISGMMEYLDDPYSSYLSE